MIGKGQQDVLTPPCWPQWRTTHHPTTSAGTEHATLEVIGSK